MNTKRIVIDLDKETEKYLNTVKTYYGSGHGSTSMAVRLALRLADDRVTSMVEGLTSAGLLEVESGHVPEFAVCGECHGYGMTPIPDDSAMPVECVACSGVGMEGDAVCSVCGGSGFTS